MERSMTMNEAAQTAARILMNNKEFTDKVAEVANSKYAIIGDHQFNVIQGMVADAFTALSEHELFGRPFKDEEIDVLTQCLGQLNRLATFEWSRWANRVC